MYERTQCRAALSDKDVKLAELKQHLIAANTQSKHAAAEVRRSLLCDPPLGGRVTRYTVRLSVPCLLLKVKRKGNVDLYCAYSVLFLSQ